MFKCSTCGGTRFKTVQKVSGMEQSYACRNCGDIGRGVAVEPKMSGREAIAFLEAELQMVVAADSVEVVPTV